MSEFSWSGERRFMKSITFNHFTVPRISIAIGANDISANVIHSKIKIGYQLSDHIRVVSACSNVTIDFFHITTLDTIEPDTIYASLASSTVWTLVDLQHDIRRPLSIFL